ncbi:UDP-N-acetylmuramoylalanine--D-glutamate ligase [Mycobacterium antarcticum]|uniref:UDP-N-acetylmuramoyl-L-alanine--D-glutamate ligase n=1 Tax=unclassified Mycolicibacterium TaxID=2636767 RepID=UPI00238E6E02|nr:MULTISPECIES: UDP-N-acetylmuramoyl-L-alanine--D-glutamate ligase [unclassified Mycolicibacterium]BDX32635.1 UDP-N-acetylmuramoylalanine--D-glutamate ligase [Mycolicibacterium sp. TUM20985]GLP83814.1 UDP-N-acetylmuramoylalanine--D-glutamate ligase [Mycolicibacterium sp. TUM20984]
MTTSPSDVTGLTVGIWGFGREGVSMARTAAAAGAARIEAVDDVGRRPYEEPAGIAGLEVFRGPEHLDRLRACDVVFVSPGVPWRQPVFADLRRSGIRISSAADWFMSRHGAATIGVTGTKGKSTTASFLGHLLRQLGVHAVVAGNIGTPLSDLTPGPGVVVVAELSSQQAALLTTSPAVAVITNLYEDHLDWHGDKDSYHLAKANVFRNGARSLVTTREVVTTLERLGVPPTHLELRLADPEQVRRIAGGERSDGRAVMSYEHNLVNGALAALAAAEVIGRPVTAAEFDAAVDDYQGLPHRLQTVRTTGRLRWIDDTLATTGESVVAALRAMRADEHVAVIVGGMDRQLNYDQVDGYLCSGERRVTLIQSPTNGAAIGQTFAAAHPSRTHLVHSLEAAVRTAASLPDVDVVLLSPGAASYDLFANYEAKAAAYRGFIDALS